MSRKEWTAKVAYWNGKSIDAWDRREKCARAKNAAGASMAYSDYLAAHEALDALYEITPVD